MSAAFDTQVLFEPEDPNGAVIMPVYRTSTYILDPEHPFDSRWLYARHGNPNTDMLEEKLATLEGGKHGYCFASGMAALSHLCLALLSPGDHIIAVSDIYAGTYKFFTQILQPKFGMEIDFVDISVCAGEDWSLLEAQLTESTRMILVESPSNPLTKLIDLGRLTALAHARGIHVCIDSSYNSPALLQPILQFGVDSVFHSLSKYIAGHSTEVGGAVILKEDGPVLPDGQTLSAALRQYQHFIGGFLAPEVAWQINQGIKTLPLRMQKHSSNAMRVATWLEAHPHVEQVLYPGLASHPQHEMACLHFQHGFGGMMAVTLKGGKPAAMAFLKALKKPFHYGVSLGGVESLVAHPASIHYAIRSAEENETYGLMGGTLRLSIGIEDPEDLIAALETAFKAISSAACS
ncbi:MAG: aminotransferase class I/II-fold pyridoxal phosphate-dependent enzyme [Cyanobacteria bacterium]|nr:aminotransferase class I/II-fold pyridoxal phosphate-dependent enzyme [Cyanobacteriota bacterium]